MNCRHCKHFTRAKQDEYCARWCKEIAKKYCSKGYCTKKEHCVYSTEPACEKFEREAPTEYQSGQAENYTGKEEEQ